MKTIEIRGTRSEPRALPAAPDIASRTALCLDHMLENTDPRFSHVPYVGVTLGEDPPHFVHHRLDCTEVLPYSIYGMVIARDITGSEKGIDIQVAQRRLYLGYFDEGDGLIHAPRMPWAGAYPLDLWEQTRALYALVYWFLDDGDEKILGRIHSLVDGLFTLSRQEGKERRFPVQLLRNIGGGPYGVGSLIDPLTKVYELTGSTRALQLAEGITHFMLNPRNGFFPEDGKLFSYFRTIVSVINGFSRFAALTDEPRVVARARAIHDQAVSFCTAFGSSPCLEPACSNMELTQSALSLIRLGHDEHWDMIDRWTRNATGEAQFLDPGEWVKSKAVKGRILDKETWVYESYPPGEPILPWDDYRDVVRRSVGGFLWSSAEEHLFVPGALMLCCSAHALRTFHLVWQNAVTEEVDGIRVNLHYTVESALADMASYEPFAGKTTIVPKRDGRVRVRIPEHARSGQVKGAVGGRKVPLSVEGRYADFGFVKAGTECTFEYDLTPRVTEERQHVFEDRDAGKPRGVIPYKVRWRGNTVIELTPASKEEKRIYRRKDFDTDKVRLQSVEHFVTRKEITW